MSSRFRSSTVYCESNMLPKLQYASLCYIAYNSKQLCCSYYTLKTIVLKNSTIKVLNKFSTISANIVLV